MFKYGDLIKDASDLLSKRYKYNRRVKFVAKSGDGVKFTTEGTLGSKGFESKLKAEFSRGAFVVDKLEVASAGTLDGEFKLVDFQGVDLSFKAHESLRTAGTLSKGVLGVTYKNDSTRVDAEVDVINGPTAKAAAMFGYDAFRVGATGTFNAKSGGLSDYGVALGYRGNGFNAGARTTNKFGNVEAGLFQEVNSKCTFAATASFAVPKGDAETDPWAVSLGGAYKLDGGASVQASVDSNGNVGGNYETTVAGGVTLGVAASIDATNLGSDKHKFGLGLTFSG